MLTRRSIAALALMALLLAGCGGDDDDAPSADAASDASDGVTSDADAADSDTEAPDDADADDGAADDADPDDAAGSAGVVPGEDTDICALFTPEELGAVVGMPLEEGAPFFSGVDENSCDWATPSDSDIIGSVSVRLASSASFVLLDADPLPIDGLGDSAEAEDQWGLTNVHYGDTVVTFQVVGAPAELPDIAARYPDLVADPESIASLADTQASIAVAETFADRLIG